jgi:biopolymer transport protein ExbD
MKMSRRARRMEQYHQKAKSPGLNLVSLMDIFTILVFFLLVNSSNTQQLPSSKDLKLPSSISKTVPDETLTIAITKDRILVQGLSVATIPDVLQGTGEIIPALKEELLFLAGGAAETAANESGAGRAVTIMGHEEIPYQVISQILKTCQQAGYTQIAFAANQILNAQTPAP